MSDFKSRTWDGRRGREGEANSQAKLTERDVREIRARYRAGEATQATLAAEYPVEAGHISRILKGEVWQHVGGALEGDLSRRTPPAVVDEIRERHKREDITHSELGEEYGISASHVTNILSGRKG